MHADSIRAPRLFRRTAFFCQILTLLLLAATRAESQGAPSILWPGGGHTGINQAAISPDGQIVASCSNFDETIKLWRAVDGLLQRRSSLLSSPS